VLDDDANFFLRNPPNNLDYYIINCNYYCNYYIIINNNYNMATQLADSIKYAEKNPAIIAGGASLALLAGYIIFCFCFLFYNIIIVNIFFILLGVFAYRKAHMKRNVHDYDSQLTGGLKILNNEGNNYLLLLLYYT